MAKWYEDAVRNPVDFISGKTARKAEDQKAEDYLAQLQAAFDGVKLPEESPLALEGYTFQGGYDPKLLEQLKALTYNPVYAEQAKAALAKLADPVSAQSAMGHTVGQSAFEDVSTDPRLKQEQMAGLAALREIADAGGHNLADRANMARIQSQVGQADRGRREAILANAKTRGMSGGGQELLAQLASSQAATDRQAQTGLDIAAQAQQRALDAIMRGSTMAGDIRGQDFGEAARIAAAKDAIAQFNAGQLQNVGMFNAGQGNAMAQFNTGQANDMARFNAGQLQNNSQFNVGQNNAFAQFNAGNQLRMDMYNQDNRFRTNAYNADAVTGARRYDAAGRQAAADASVGVRNQAATHNAGAPYRQYGAALDLARGKAGLASAGMDYWGGRATADQKAHKEATRDIATGGGEVAAAAYNKYGAAAGAAHGGVVPGKPKHHGDHPVNDMVLTLLSPGEVVLPRSVVKNPSLLDDFLANLKSIDMPGPDPKVDDKDLDIKLAAVKLLAGKMDKKKGKR